MLHDVADKPFGVHATGQLRNHVISLLDPHAFQVRIDWRVHARFHEIAADDQVCDLRALNHHIEQITEPATVAAAWGCRHAEQRGLRIETDQMLARSATCTVRLVKYHKVGWRQVHRTGPHAAHQQRVDARDLDGLHRARADLRHDDPMPHAIGSQFGAGLIDNFAPMREKNDAAILDNPAADQFRGDHRLAAAGRGHK
jgi:hypothetical protein